MSFTIVLLIRDDHPLGLEENMADAPLRDKLYLTLNPESIMEALLNTIRQ